MLNDITKWTRYYVACQRSKVHRHTVSPIQAFASIPERLQQVHVDLVGPLPPSDGFTYLLTCIDLKTRCLKSMLRIQRIRTTPYHPSSNGMVERLHRSLKQALRYPDTKGT
ncbi:retrovirus-related Pol polyprotein from transposon 412 [Nephila pilipes]|uniref:Retrovirus-related Pol polyprotein from transposon 412 n=1 Tax=Nephila pilipes TaxID=299642 RepID=A0A8X6QTV1_NEPPI|nr:retrovirus-related Pol polyprotein from transposon 412 [Nephila pilipes]